MPFDIGQVGQQAAEGVAGTVLGLALEKHNDKRQLKQQQKLTDIQTAANRQQAQFSSDLQYDMWLKTNYGAQIEQLKKAGLNPGLIYGMSGGGGATTGSAQAGGASGAAAPSGGGEIMGMLSQKMQLALLGAQKENIEADTAKKNVEAQKTAGVDTTKTETEIASLTQGIENQQAQKRLTEIQTQLDLLQKQFLEGTMQHRMDYILWQAAKAENDVQQVALDIELDAKTLKDKINIVHTEALGAILKNIQIQAQTQNTQAGTQKTLSDIKINQQQISNWVQQNEINWRTLSINEKRQRMEELLGDFKMYDEPTLRIVEQAVDGLFRGATQTKK